MKTQSGTIVKEAVEYTTYPPPYMLIKVMKRCYAEEFVSAGSIRFGSLESYRRWENEALGDRCDGKGMFRMNGHSYNVESSNPLYAWCSAQTHITTKRVLLLAYHGKYDCIVRVHQPRTLIERMKAALLAQNRKLLMHCAEVTYNRGTDVDKVTLNAQKFHYNLFQKDPRFSEDCEYRIAVTDVGVKPQLEEHIELKLGPCSDIAFIEDLPMNENSKASAYGSWRSGFWDATFPTFQRVTRRMR